MGVRAVSILVMMGMFSPQSVGVRTAAAQAESVASPIQIQSDIPSVYQTLSSSRWFELTGTDYIDTAFRAAHEAAPHTELFINDYGTTDPVKRMFLYNLVRDLRARGVPIDGVGHQMHINIHSPTVEAIAETIHMFSALGVDNQITELDVSIYDNSTDSCPAISQDALIEQGYRYRDLFQTFRALNGEISGVTFWGLADDHTWLKGFPISRLNLPLLFDEHLQAKPAYWGIVDPTRLPARPVSTQPPAATATPSPCSRP